MQTVSCNAIQTSNSCHLQVRVKKMAMNRKKSCLINVRSKKVKVRILWKVTFACFDGLRSLVSLMYLNFTDVCENCCGVAYFFCSECKNSYCQSCSYVRHKHPRRKTHNLVRLSVVPKTVKHIPPCPSHPGEGVSGKERF